MSSVTCVYLTSRIRSVASPPRKRPCEIGWEGIATARYEFLNGCVRVELSAAGKDGEPKSHVFDSQQLELVPAAKSVKVERKKTGGPPVATPIPR